MRYDLAVIGSGGAGFAAAISARRKDYSVVMVERGAVGGTCVNTGCVPSKALLAAAGALQASRTSPFPGIAAAPFELDVTRLIEDKRALAECFRNEKYVDLAAHYGWEIVGGSARFVATRSGPELTVELNEGGVREIDAEHYVIATGSTPWAPPIEGLTEAGYLTSTTAMELDRLPSSMIVLGGNAVGLEQAQLWNRLGVEVTVVEALPRLAPFEEPEVSQVIEQVFADEGIQVVTAAQVVQVRRDHTGYHLSTSEGRELPAEQLLAATGRRPVSAGLGLGAVGVKTGPRGEVVVDDHLCTGNPRIWAAGDVTGHPQFVYVAGAHGALVVDNALDNANRVLDYSALPKVTFTSPAIATVGLTDAEAFDAGYACECRVVPLRHIPRALVDRDTRGVIKLVAERGSGRLLGVHLAANGASEVISAAGYALAAGMTVHQLAEQWSPYLTMAEGLKIAAQAFTRDVSKLSCCAA